MDSKWGSEIWLRKKWENRNIYLTDTSITNLNYAAVLKIDQTHKQRSF